MKKNELRVPSVMKLKYEAIAGLTDKFSDEKLNSEYKYLAKKLAAKLCRKKDHPLNSGSEKVWAASIIHAIGMVNFLYDKSVKPNITNAELIDWFGVSQSTVSGRSKKIRDMFNFSQMNYEWMLPSNLNDMSSIWFIVIDEFIMDIRDMPLDIQEAAFNEGLIPYIPSIKDVEACE